MSSAQPSVDMGTATAPREDDAGLVTRILAGEHTLFERLVRRYNQRFYRAARAQLRDDATAEDAMQQGWMSIYRALRSEERRVGKECRTGWSENRAEDGIRDIGVTGVQTCALPIYRTTRG